MRCPENSIELFFVGEVLTKGVASQDMEDENGHCVLEGERYHEVNYLEKDREGKNYFTYKRSRQASSFLHLAEVFAYQVDVNLDLKMSINEYQSLTLEALKNN